jgi:DNA end-binding protein Ku
MAQHAFWKGHLKLSLVTCAVSLTPATSEGGRLRFQTLNAATGNPVRSEYVDAETGRVVEDGDQVKAYRQGEDDYVILEDEELDEVALESTRTIDIDLFTDPESVSWIWYDRPHYLMPDDKVGREAFAVIRDAMDASGKVGIARIVLYRRERALLLKPCKPGIIAWTLRYGDEVRPAPDVAALEKSARPDAADMKEIEGLIQRRLRDWDQDMLADPVQRELQRLIAAKQRKERGTAKGGGRRAAPKGEGNVIDIMEALRRSLGAEETPARR